MRAVETGLRRQHDQTRREIAQLHERVNELTAPQVNVPIFDVVPVELARRTLRPTVTVITIPPRAKSVTLILLAQSAATYRTYSVEMADAQNKILWSQGGLVRNPTNDYTINVRTELVPPGRYTINIFGEADGQRARVESYWIRFQLGG